MANTDTAYMGRILRVDLSGGTFSEIGLPLWIKEAYLGGKGFGAKLLFDLVPGKADPLGPDNVLMFLTGPLTATTAPAMRACVVTKSPLTHTYLDSYFGGYFGPEIKFAGYDGIIFTGKSPEPVYLYIDHRGPSLQHAKDLAGKTILETSANIKKAHGDPDIKVAAIGPAGENMVSFALIGCETNRQAGRGGAGAVMGAKNLKAVALKGNSLVRLCDPCEFFRAARAATKEIDESAECRVLMEAGTASAVEFAEAGGMIPSKNFTDGTSFLAKNLGDHGQKKKLWLNRAACFGCPIGCSQMGAVRTGKYKGFVTDIVEYETAAMLGTNLEIGDPRAVAYLNRLCDNLGLDTISTGSCVGFAFEAAEKGILSPGPGIELAFGNVAAAAALIERIARKDGDIGRLLAGGVKAAAAAIGPQAEALAHHVKGLEVPAWGPRGTPGMGLAYVTADRGACHQRAFPAGHEISGAEWNGKPVEALALEGKAEMVISMQNSLAGTDCLVKCDFGAMGVTSETYARLLNAATGMNADASFFGRLGNRVWNTTRIFNLREGMDTADEKLPRRFTEEPLPSGPHKGHRITGEDMKYLLADYYALRGWDEIGRPTAETLEKAGVDRKRRFGVAPSGER